ncbi:MAG: DUF2029 domain-containing protein [Alphaproteobacteria bacterium]|nr:DUF2029 domain-containing protein [Alphaproteobacteria bacterium]MCB9794323.1 DUF2029 domain-containing protein [Alphaproteobacteria bacterium]
MNKASLRRWLSWAALLAAFALFTTVPRGAVFTERPRHMADALPLYLYAAAVDEGLSPIDPDSLREIYERRDMGVKAATWSTLYPATAGVLMRPFAALSWKQFEAVWAWVLMAATLAVGLLIPTPGGGSPERRRLTWALGVSLMALTPASVETARLGQVNMLLAALSAAALVLSLRRRDLLGGALLGLGACLKLVPAAVALPLFLGGRWRVAVGGCLIGLPALALAFGVTPPEALIAGLRDTSAFQSIITPAWLVNPELPRWIWHLGFTRHTALMSLTGIVAVTFSLWRPGPGVLVGAGALVLAWLGTSASVFHLLYTPLYAPAWLWICAWALDPRAPRWTWPLSFAYAVAGVWFPAQYWWGIDPTVACMLFGFLVWLGVLARTLWEAGLAEERGPLAPLLERWPSAPAAAYGLAGVWIVAKVGLPGDGPVDAPLTDTPGQEIRRTGVGFIDPDERPPGAGPDWVSPLPMLRAPEDGAWRWPEMPVTGALTPRSRKPLDAHLQAAPDLWLSQAAALQDPALAEAARALAASTPRGAFTRLPYQSLATWLASEGVLMARIEAQGQSVPALRESWEAVLDPGSSR